MRSEFVINTDRLRDGKKLEIDCKVLSQFLATEEHGPRFEGPIALSGSAYIADHQLILNLHIQAPAVLSCSICNDEASVPINIQNFYHVEDLKELRGAIFDYGQVLREEILLEIPQFTECNQGDCPERKHINNYLEREKL